MKYPAFSRGDIYSAFFDERIKLAVPSCAFCSYKKSIMAMYHCACNYIPKAYNYFDMGDLACLIEPRNLLVIAGELDHGFLIEGVHSQFETVKKIYKKEGMEERSRLIVTEKGHWWCEDIVWEEIRRETTKLGL